MKALIPTKLAEVLYAVIILVFAFGHFSNAAEMSSYVPSYMPGGGEIWIYITGTGLALAGIAIIFGIQKTLACYLLAAQLLVFVFTMHLEPAMEGNMGNLLKDSAMAMAAIMIGNRSAKS